MTDSPVTETPPARTPLHGEHIAAGGRMVPFAGWELPVRYSDVADEHRAVRTAAGLFDVSHMGEVAVRGAGATAYLDRLTPNHVAKLTPGRAHYSGFLTEDGTYIDDILVFRIAEDDFLVVVNAGNTEAAVAWMHEHVEAGEEVEVEDLSDQQALLALQGPKAEAILDDHTDVDLQALRYYRFAHGRVFGKPAVVSRTGYTGEDGFELYLAPGNAAHVWRSLLESGRGDGLLPCGLGARDTLRLEAGMALYGHEIDRGRTPYEAGLGWVVKLDKGEFIGRSALVAQKEAGVAEKLIGFTVTGRGIAREGATVRAGGEVVGTVLSGTFGPTVEKAIGTAYVPTRLAEPGTPLEIEVRRRSLDAEIVPLPFYKRPR